MSSLLNSTNKRVGDSKSIYPITINESENKDYIDNIKNAPETVKENFNTLLIYIIKMLMKDIKNPYDGFKVDNYVLFENSQDSNQSNKILSNIPALHKPDQSIKTDNFDDIENLIRAQMAINESSFSPDNTNNEEPWNQTRFNIIDSNLHKGWSRKQDGTILKTLIDNLINTNPSKKGGGKKKINGGSNSQNIFQKIMEAQIFDIQPFKTYALSIKKNSEYQTMEKEIKEIISSFESQYKKTNDYNKQVKIIAELSNSLYQKKLQNFHIFSEHAMKEIEILRNKANESNIEKNKHEKDLKDLKEKLSATKGNYSNINRVNRTIDDYLNKTKSTDLNTRREVAKKLSDSLKNNNLDSNLYNDIMFLLNSSEIQHELKELLEISRSVHNNDFSEIEKKLEDAKESNKSLKTRNDMYNIQTTNLVREKQQLMKQLERERTFTQSLGRELDSEIANNEQDKQDNLLQISILQQEIENIQIQLESQRMQAEEQGHETIRKIQELQQTHQREIDDIRARSAAVVEMTAKAGEDLANEEIEKLQKQHKIEMNQLQEEQLRSKLAAEAATAALQSTSKKQFDEIMQRITQEKDTIIQKKNTIIQQKDTTIQEKEKYIQEKEKHIETLLDQQKIFAHENDTYKSEVSKLKSLNETIMSEIANLRDKNNELEAKNEKERLDILNQTEENITDLEKRFYELSDSLKEQLVNSEEEILKLDKQIEEKNKMIELLQLNIKECELKVKELTAINTELNKQIKDIERSQFRNNENNESLKMRIEELSKIQQKLKEENEEAKISNRQKIIEITKEKDSEYNEMKNALEQQNRDDYEKNRESYKELEEGYSDAFTQQEEELSNCNAEKLELQALLEDRQKVSDEYKNKFETCEKELKRKDKEIKGKDKEIERKDKEIEGINDKIQEHLEQKRIEQNKLLESKAYVAARAAEQVATKTTQKNTKQKNIIDGYIDTIKYVVLRSPFDDFEESDSNRSEKIKEYILSEIAKYFFEENIKSMQGITNYTFRLKHAVALDILLYILTSIADKNLINEDKEIVTDLINKRATTRREQQEINDKITKLFYDMILFDVPQASYRRAEATPKESRYIKKLPRNTKDITIPIGASLMHDHIKNNVLYERGVGHKVGPDDTIHETLKSIISSIKPHIIAMSLYFYDKIFKNQYKDVNSDNFLSNSENETDEVKRFLTELQNINDKTIIEFSKYIKSESLYPRNNKQLSVIDEIQHVIKNPPETTTRAFKGGSSSRLVYSLKKGKTNKGNKTKRNKTKRNKTTST